MPIRIVLADDHPALREGIRTRFHLESDFEIVGEADTGEEALRLTNQLRPDVLLLDLELPGLSGIEVARRLKAGDSATRILVLSAHDDEEYIVRLLDGGALGYLTKQEPLEAIVRAVRGVARGEEGWLSRDVAAALMRLRRSRGAGNPIRMLSVREREVLALLARGQTNQQIGDELFITEHTVKKHVNNIYFKLEVGSRAEAVAWAWKHGIVESDRPADSSI